LRLLLAKLFLLLATFVYGQESAGRLYLKTGAGRCNFRPNSKGAEKAFAYGYQLGIAADLDFKKNRKITRSGELLFINKGGYNIVPLPTYDQYGQPAGIGAEIFPVKLNYLSASSGLKLKLSKFIYLNLSARLDYLLSVKSKAKFYSDDRRKNDFKPFTGGLSYSVGFLKFEKSMGIFVELQGQNDMTKSGDKKGGLFYNNYYGLNIGFHFLKYKDKESR